jgi:hypothetical protein
MEETSLSLWEIVLGIVIQSHQNHQFHQLHQYQQGHLIGYSNMEETLIKPVQQDGEHRGHIGLMAIQVGMFALVPSQCMATS